MLDFSGSSAQFERNPCTISTVKVHSKSGICNNVYTVFNLDLHSINIDTETYKILSLSEILKKDLKQK